MMNPDAGSPMSQMARLAVAKDDGRLPLTEWIEQLQEFHGARSVAPELPRDWEDAYLPYLPAAPTRQDVEELGRRLTQLAQRIRALEQR
jgi:hypothetical protein